MSFCRSFGCKNKIYDINGYSPNNCRSCIIPFQHPAFQGLVYKCTSLQCNNQVSLNKHGYHNKYCFKCYENFYLNDSNTFINYKCVFCQLESGSRHRIKTDASYTKLCCNRCSTNTNNCDVQLCFTAIDALNTIDINMSEFLQLIADASDVMSNNPNKIIAFKNTISSAINDSIYN